MNTKTFETSRMTNPVIRRLSNVTDVAVDERHAASYRGICSKTIFFLLLTVAGICLFFILHNGIFSTEQMLTVDSDAGPMKFGLQETLLVAGAGIVGFISALLARFVRGAVAFFGIIYSISQGYIVGFLATVYQGTYQSIVWIALGLTILIVFIMLILYTTRIIKVTAKFKAVIGTLFFTAFCSGILVFVGSLIPFTRNIISVLAGNPVLNIITSVVFIIIAALFLLSDFDAIENTVKHQLPKKYEWNAAFGLVMTVIWLYFKILNLLTKVMPKKG